MYRLPTISIGLILLIPLGCSRSKEPNAISSQQSGDAEAAAGQGLMKSRQFAEAIPHLQRATEQPLQRYAKSDVLSMIGNCYNELREMEQSLKYHDLAIAEDPNNHKAYVNKGIVYRLQGEYDKAEKMYTQALSLAPDYAELHASMGALFMHKEDYEGAIEHLKRSIELDKSMPVAHSNLAVAYATVGRFDEAEAELKRAVVLGYQKPEVIQERIEKLRQIAAKQ